MGLAFLFIHFSAIIFVLKMSAKRSANIHLWGALASCWGLFIIPYFMLVTSVKQSEMPLFKKIQNSTTLI